MARVRQAIDRSALPARREREDLQRKEDRQASVCREISKLHEESVRGTLAEIIDHFKQTEPRGEIVVVVAGCAGVDISARKALKEQAKEKKPKLSNKERYAMREAAPAEFKKKKFRDE